MRPDKKNKFSKRAANYAQDFPILLSSLTHTHTLQSQRKGKTTNKKSLRFKNRKFFAIHFFRDSIIVQMLSSSYFQRIDSDSVVAVVFAFVSIHICGFFFLTFHLSNSHRFDERALRPTELEEVFLDCRHRRERTQFR